MNLKTCPNCQSVNEQNKPFCRECGAPLAVPDFLAVCPVCGAANTGNKRFCGDCGASLACNGPSVAAPTTVPVETALQSNDDFVIERKVLKEYRGNDVNLVVPDGVTTIGEGALANFVALQSIVLPEGLIYIEEGAFRRCESLTEIVLPDSLTDIKQDAFSGCKALRKIVVGKGLTFVGAYAFWKCDALGAIQFRGDFLTWCGTRRTGLSNLMFAGKNKELSMEDGVPLEDVVVPAEVEELDVAFAGTSIRSVRVESRKVNDHAFAFCGNLQNAVLTDQVKDIGKGVFCECTALESLTIPFAMWKIDNSKYYHIGRLFGEVQDDEKATTKVFDFFIPNSLREVTIGQINGNSFAGCKYIQTVHVRAGDISFMAFTGCSSLATVTLPLQCRNIGGSAFEGCSSLSKITLPDGLTAIYEDAFYSCKSLKSIVVPESVKKIGSKAFGACTSLQYAALLCSPDSDIGARAAWPVFYGCSALTTIVLPKIYDRQGERAETRFFSVMERYFTGGYNRGLEEISRDAKTEFGENNYKIHSISWIEGELYKRGARYGGEYKNAYVVFPKSLQRLVVWGGELCESGMFNNVSFDIVVSSNVNRLGCFAPKNVKVYYMGSAEEAKRKNACERIIPNAHLDLATGRFSVNDPSAPEVVAETNIVPFVRAGQESAPATDGWDGRLDIAIDIDWFYRDNATAYAYVWYKDAPNPQWPGTALLKDDGGDYVMIDPAKSFAGLIVTRVIDGKVYNKTEDITALSPDHKLVLVEKGREKPKPQEMPQEDATSTTTIQSGMVKFSVADESESGEKTESAPKKAWDGRLDVVIDIDWFHRDGAVAYVYVWYEGDNQSQWPGTVLSKDEKGYYVMIDTAKKFVGLILVRVVKGVAFNKSGDITEIPDDHTLVIAEMEKIPGAVSAPKEGTDENGIKYRLQEDDTYSVIDLGAAADVVIPAQFHGKAVTAIWGSAIGSKTLVSLTLPASILSIGSGKHGADLSALMVDADNPKFHSTGNCIIDTQKKSLVLGCEKSVIPADGSVIEIGERAFCGCGFSTISLPDSIKAIKGRAFEDCENLSAIVLPAKLQSIGCYAFSQCNLTLIDIPATVKEIGSDAFAGNPFVTFAYPNGIRYIEGGCEGTSVEQVTIPGSVERFGIGIFRKCYSLRTIVYAGSKKQWEAIDKGHIWMGGKKHKWDDQCADFVVQCTDGIIKK